MSLTCPELSTVSPDNCFKFVGPFDIRENAKCSKNVLNLQFQHGPFIDTDRLMRYDPAVNKFYIELNITNDGVVTASCTGGDKKFNINPGLIRPGTGQIYLETTGSDPEYRSYPYALFHNINTETYDYFYTDGYLIGAHFHMFHTNLYDYIQADSMHTQSLVCPNTGLQKFYLETNIVNITGYNFYDAIKDFSILEYEQFDWKFYVLADQFTSYLAMSNLFSSGQGPHCENINSSLVYSICCNIHFYDLPTLSNFTLLDPIVEISSNPWFIATLVLGPLMLLMFFAVPIAWLLGKPKVKYVTDYEFTPS